MADETEPNEPYGEDPLDLEDRVIDLENMVALHADQIKLNFILALAGLRHNSSNRETSYDTGITWC